MRIIKQFKKNNGSTLTLVLFMIFMLSVTAIAVVTLTGSELSMSVMASDRSKALLIAQAGAEKAAQVLDKTVAQAQEDARVISSQRVQEEIKKFQRLVWKDIDGDGTYEKVPIDIISPFINVIDNSDINDIKILDENELNEIYEGEYKYQFNIQMDNLYSAQNVIRYGNTINMNATSLIPGDSSEGIYTYGAIEKITGADVVSPIGSGTTPSINSFKLTSTGEYKSPSNSSTYKRTIEAELGLLTDSISSEIPVSYGKLTKVRYNKDEKPSILNGKALIAQKNIISVDGVVNVTGDTVCFGTMPRKGVAGPIDYDTDGYKFGGIMAGMVSSNNSEVNNIWEDKNFRGGDPSFKNTLTAISNELAKVLEIDSDTDGDGDIDYFNTNYSGSFDFDGNVGTLAYLHSLYNINDRTNIAVSGNTFARGVNVESESNYSTIKLNNVYFYDDLRIDGNKSIVKIGGWDEDNINPDPYHEGTLVGLNKGGLGKPVSSSVIVAGDSNLYINGSVYVGGSTSYRDYTNSNGAYESGMSIQKSDSRPAKAFVKDGNPKNDQNIFYYYKNTTTLGEDPYLYVNSPMEPEKNTYTTYNPDTASPVEMMTGKSSDISLPEVTYDIEHKAMHLKYIWDEFWNKDIRYASYFNTGDIVITLDTNNKIKGFCNGGVAANNTIYGPYKGFTVNDPAVYNGIVDGTPTDSGLIADYAKFMDLFIDNKGGLDKPTPPKNLSSSVNKGALTVNKLYPNNYITGSSSFMYYSNDNVVLSNGYVNGNQLTSYSGYLNGIVYSDKDIYVKDGTKFKGILIAEGNIVFFGDANIEYNESVVDNLLCEEPLIGRFFKHSASDLIMNDPKAIVQTIKKKDVKNIKIISWKEI